MLSGRQVEQNKPSLIDNLEQVAANIYSYVLDVNNLKSLIDSIQKTQEIYIKPINSWIPLFSFFYGRYRNRIEDITDLAQILKENITPFDLLKAIVEFFSTGGWESTSANTELMRSLISKLARYSKEDEEKFMSPDILHRLNQLFLKKAHNTINNEKSLQQNRLREKELNERTQELKILQTSDHEELKQKLNEMLSHRLFSMTPASPPKIKHTATAFSPVFDAKRKLVEGNLKNRLGEKEFKPEIIERKKNENPEFKKASSIIGAMLQKRQKPQSAAPGKLTDSPEFTQTAQELESALSSRKPYRFG